MNNCTIESPFLKWVGGKTQLLSKILEKTPKSFNNYHEPFVGGGSVLLAILSLEKEGKITISGNVYAYDKNEELINVYKNVQSNKKQLLKYITKYIDQYNGITGTIIDRKSTTLKKAQTSKESYYYYLRYMFNTLSNSVKNYSAKKAAMFMVINKLCFRGLYRMGPNGFNVPYGHYKKTPTIITKEKLDRVSELIKNVIFTCSDFEVSIGNAKKGDYVYLDPPYFPENKKSFTKYTANGFGLDSHKKLFRLTKKISNNNVLFLMSNSNVVFVEKYFDKYNIEKISARRAINSKNPNSTTFELLITNVK